MKWNRLRAVWPWLPLIVLYVLTRLPLLPVGFGSDSDAWSVANTARELVVRGLYSPSRLPGHPFHEALQALFITTSGAVGANAFTLLVSLALLWVVWRLGHHLAGGAPVCAVVCLAVHPLFWITSADGTDFVLASLLAHAALLSHLNGRAVAAGVLLGLASATRIETAAFVVPLAVLATGRWRDALRTTVVAGLVGASLYVPVVLTYGHFPGAVGDLFLATWGLRPRAERFLVALWASWGLIPGAVCGALVVAKWKRLWGWVKQGDLLALSTGGLAGAFLIITFVHPTKPTYYVPVLPLVLLCLGRLGTGLWRLALPLAFLTYSLVYPDIVDREGTSVRFTFRWNNGLVVKDWISRQNAVHAAATIDKEHPAGGVLVLGYWLPMWHLAHPEATLTDEIGPGIRVAWSNNAAFRLPDGTVAIHKLDQPSALAITNAGLALAYGEGIEDFLAETYGYDIRRLGATLLHVRCLGADVSEHFTLPMLLRCAVSSQPFDTCVADSGRPGE